MAQGAMPATRTLDQTLAELRRLRAGSAPTGADARGRAAHRAHVIGNCRTLAIEKRASGIAIRLQVADRSRQASVCSPASSTMRRGFIAAHSLRARRGRPTV